MTDVDIVVAGAGPAGLATACHAARAGLRVLVLDPRGGVIDKACGEGIMPGGVEALAELAVRPRGLPFVGIRYVDARDDSLAASGRFPSGHGLGVRRTELQPAMKTRALDLGVRFEDSPVRAFEPSSDAVIVNGNIKARFLVGADGLHSRIRRELGVEEPRRHVARLGLRRHFAVAPWSSSVEVHFGERAEAYVTPVDHDLVGIAFLFEPHGPAPSFDELLAGFPGLAGRVHGVRTASTIRGAGPFEQRVRRRVVGRVLLVGDAAGYVDPLTGDGIALGLSTARAAVQSILEGAPEAYEERYRRITWRYAWLTATLLAVARRRVFHRSLLLAAAAFPRVFDGVLGLLGRLPSGDGARPALAPLAQRLSS